MSRCKACDKKIGGSYIRKVYDSEDGTHVDIIEDLCPECRRQSEIEVTASDIFGHNSPFVLQKWLGGGNYVRLPAFQDND